MFLTERPDRLDGMASPDERRTAAGFVHEAFAESILAGVDTRAFAEAAIAVGLEELVARYGEDAVVDFAGRLLERVRGGEFSLAMRH